MGWFSDALEGGANIMSFGTYGVAKDALSQDEVDVPDIDKKAFQRAGVQEDIKDAKQQQMGYQKTAQNARLAGEQAARTSTQAGALGYDAARGDAYAARDAGQQFQQNQGTQRLAYQNQAGNVQGRTNPTLNTSEIDRARAAQYNALGGVADQAGKGADTSALRNFYQQGPGPSAAQAQLQTASEQNMATALAMARSGRAGANPAAERAALFANSATSAQTAQQMAALRAQEEAANRGMNLNAMTAEQQAIAQGRQAQLQALGLQQNTLAGMGDRALTQSTTEANLALQGRDQNDRTALSYEQLAQQAQALGLQGGLGYGQLANQSMSNGGQYQIGMTNAGTGQQQAGNQLYATDTAAGLSYAGMGNTISEQERQAQINYEALKAGQQMSANQANAQSDAQRDAAMIGMVGSAAGMAMKSDIRAKKDLKKLDDLSSTYAALGGPPATAGVRRDDVDTDSLDRYNLRPAQGYSYKYKDPSEYGSRTFTGPMAQDLERSPATAATVNTGPDGSKRIDTNRLSLVNTSAISEQQKKLDALRSQVQALAEDKYQLDYAPVRKRAREPAPLKNELGYGSYY
jgi:hypothetical protein